MTDFAYLTVRNLSKPLHAALKKLAAANRRSVNAEVVMAIERHVAAHATAKAIGDSRGSLTTRCLMPPCQMGLEHTGDHMPELRCMPASGVHYTAAGKIPAFGGPPCVCGIIVPSMPPSQNAADLVEALKRSLRKPTKRAKGER